MNIIKMLCTKIPGIVTTHHTAVMKACMEKVKNVVNHHITHKLHPKLHDIILCECTRILERQFAMVKDHHDLIISWEDSISSSNHYFMDTVQSIRKIIFKEEGESSQKDEKVDKPYYLKHLSDTKIKAMINEDQRLVAM